MVVGSRQLLQRPRYLREMSRGWVEGAEHTDVELYNQ